MRSLPTDMDAALRSSRALATVLGFLLANFVSGCGQKNEIAGGPSASPTAIAATSSATPEASAENIGGAQSSPAPSQARSSGPVNLLSAQQGTILRSWPATGSGLQSLLGEGGWTAKDGSTGPYVVVYELAAPGTIDHFVFYSGGDAVNDAQTLHFAVSTTNATSGFNDIGTYQLTGSGRQDVSLNPPVQARWIKLTIDAHGRSKVSSIAAMGTLTPRKAAPLVGGVWKYFQGDPYQSLASPNGDAGVFPDSFDSKQLALADSILDVRQTGAELSAGICSRQVETALHGNEQAGVVILTGGNAAMSPAVVNSEGTLMVGYGGGAVNWFAARFSGSASCDSVFAKAAPQGTGEPVLDLFAASPDTYVPYSAPTVYPGYRISPLLLSLLEPKSLGGFRITVLASVCDAASILTKTQAQALMDWVYSGNKLIIHDADDCKSTDYSFLPYTFTSSNPGAHAARGNNLVLVNSNTLGSNAADKTHFVDVAAYIAATGQQLGDANVVTTQDSHWCGHFYGTNVLGQNGFIQMFAPFGQGLIIYDGFDRDDSDIAQYQKIVLLELRQPPGAALACDQLVSTSFTVAPSSVSPFAPGKPLTKTFALTVFASHGYKGAVNVAVQPPANARWQTTLSPTHVLLNGDTANVTLTVKVPQSARSGSYPFVVKGTDGAGQTASATETLASAAGTTPVPVRTALVPATPKIAKALATTKRVAIYGINFDFASATLRPDSAPVLKEIAAVLAANPSWNLIIEGHTDNVGGAAYNLDLSKRRALAVKDALVTHYSIAANRLSGIGYGFSRPKASNDTPLGRALNRRVELVRQ
jgi:outer membrane protein OmpA-like peptidoglycan-associated protein